MRTYEEKLKYEVNKLIGNKGEQNRFFANAINIQRCAYETEYAQKKFDFACDVLQSSGFCNSGHPCEGCKLYKAHEIAKNDILIGRRKVKPKRRYRIEGDYIVSFSVDKKTGIVTQVMKPLRNNAPDK